VPFLDAVRQSLLGVRRRRRASLLYERGVFVTQNFEQSTSVARTIVRKIHGRLLEAGANVIPDQTFGANRFCLGATRSLGGRGARLHLAGARIAREGGSHSA